MFPEKALPVSSFFQVNGADGTAVTGLLGSVQHLSRYRAAVGQAVVSHGEYRGAGSGAQAAADAVFVDACVHCSRLQSRFDPLGRGGSAVSMPTFAVVQSRRQGIVDFAKRGPDSFVKNMEIA